jgi:glycosyl transferase family 87
VKNVLAFALITFAFVILLATPSPLPPGIGAVDFRPFWSASYLFIRGEDFTNADRLFQVQRELTDWRTNYPMLVWNPPWLFLILAPYTLVSFSRAVWWWALTNVILTAIAAIVLWHCSSQDPMTKRKIWIGLFLFFVFSMTLVTITEGQVDSLVLIGFAGFVCFLSAGRDEFAGASLVLTTVKPQLVFVTLPVLLLHLIYKRRWHAVTAFILTFVVGVVASFGIRPTWLQEFVSGFSKGPVLNWQVPTLGGVLEVAFGWFWAKWIGVMVLPLAICTWFYWRGKWNWRTLLDASLLLSVMATPYAWSFDQILLLVPMMSVVVWIWEGAIDDWNGRLIIFILILIDVITLYERVLTPGELYFFWVPISFTLIYTYGWRCSKGTFAYA